MRHGAWQIDFETGYTVIVAGPIEGFTDALRVAQATISQLAIVGASYHPRMFVEGLEPVWTSDMGANGT